MLRNTRWCGLVRGSRLLSSALLQNRMSLWDQEMLRQTQDTLHSPNQVEVSETEHSCTLRLDDQTQIVRQHKIWVKDIIKDVEGDSKDIVALKCKETGKLYDLHSAVESETSERSLQVIYKQSEIGKEVLSHSAAHLLGYALEQR